MRTERRLMSEAALVVTEVSKWRGFPGRCPPWGPEVLSRCRLEARRLVKRRCAEWEQEHPGIPAIGTAYREEKARAIATVAASTFKVLTAWDRDML